MVTVLNKLIIEQIGKFRTSLFLGAYVKMRVGEELKIRRIA
jgi:hypothetical protein